VFRRVRLLAVVLLCCSVGTVAWAAEEGCGDTVELDRFQFFRQLTLDLFGRVPTLAELEPIIHITDVGEAQVDAMLSSAEFSRFVRRYHLDLLWPNVDAFELVNPALSYLLPASLYDYSSGNADRLFVLFVGLYERGGLVPCKDAPAEYDRVGNLIFEEFPDGTQREGWVEVEPYWAPGTTVKVCALEARTAMISSDGLACDQAEGMLSGRCGCGPNLQHCLSIESGQAVQQSLQEQFLRMIEAPINEERSYYDMLLAENEDLNGALIHYYRYLAPMAIDPIMQYPPVPVAELPTDVPFTDPFWTSYARPAEHSGVLTTVLYLLRFQTDRARANRFYNAFFCAPFQAPQIELPSPSDPCSNEPNLRKRCGCSYCHSALEPAAAYWGRFADAGTLYLHPLSFPDYSEDCATCINNPLVPCKFICQRFYFTQAGHPDEEPYVGFLKALVFSDEEEKQRVLGGPRMMVEQALAAGTLATCTIRRLFERLHNRPMSPDEEQEMMVDLVTEFDASGHDFKALVKRLALLPSYRRLAR